MLGNFNDVVIEGCGPHLISRVSTLTLQQPVAYDLQDLEIVSTLGQGAFSKIKLVKAKDTGVFYALKVLGKQ